MSNAALIGKAKELYIAYLLFEQGLYVYTPLLDSGFDFLVTDKNHKKIVPLQVKYKKERTGFSLLESDVEKFSQARAVIAFGDGDANLENFYFIPADKFTKKASDYKREDKKLVIRFSEEKNWATQFKGEDGLKKAFAEIIGVEQ